MSAPVEGVDARTDRVAQSAVGIALLAAFVFRVTWVVPAVGAVLTAGALGGPRANVLDAGFDRFVAPRLPGRTQSADEPIAVGTVRLQDALGAGLLAVGCAAFLVGAGMVGWAFAIAEAVVAIVAATTRVHVADRLRRWI